MLLKYRILIIFSLAAFLICPTFTLADSLSDVNATGFYDYEPQISDTGWLTWIREDIETGEQEICRSNGIGTEQLSTIHDSMKQRGSGTVGDPVINNNGWVAWSAVVDAHWQIFLFDGEKTTQLTQNDRENISPQINDNGWVTWQSTSEHDASSFIFLYDTTSTTQLSQSSIRSHGPVISNNTSVAWFGLFGNNDFDINSEIFLYNGKQTMQLTHSSGLETAPEINDRWITWSGRGSANGADSEIWLYDGAQILQLTNNDYDDRHPHVNKNGWVSWFRDYRGMDVFLYDGTETTQLTSGLFAGHGADTRINDKGWVAWSSWDVGSSNDLEIYLYDGIKTMQLTHNDFDDKVPQINNIGWDPILYLGAQATALSGNNGLGDNTPPKARLWVPKISARASKTAAFKVRWAAADPSAMAWETQSQGNKNIALAGSSGIKSYIVQVKPAGTSVWKDLITNTTSTRTHFRGKPGKTYYFRVGAEDNSGNIGWSKAARTVVPYNEQANVRKRFGFRGYYINPASRYYMGSVRYSRTAGHTLIYKLRDTKGIGLVATRGPDRGRAKIYIDGKYSTTVDAYATKRKFRRLIFSKSLSRKKTHYLRIVVEGTPGRPRFDVDAVVATR